MDQYSRQLAENLEGRIGKKITLADSRGEVAKALEARGVSVSRVTLDGPKETERDRLKALLPGRGDQLVLVVEDPEREALNRRRRELQVLLDSMYADYGYKTIRSGDVGCFVVEGADRIIDFHTHIFPNKVAEKAIPQMYEYCRVPYYAGGGSDELIASMEKSRVVLSVNHPVCTNPGKADSLNRFAQELARRPGMASFGCLHPELKNWREELRTFRDRGLIGLKIHNDYQGFYFNSKLCLDMISAAFEEGLMVLVHAGADPVSPEHHCTPAMIAQALPLLRQGVFIAAHLGGLMMLDEAMRHVIGQDIYIDTSMAAIYCSDTRCREAILAHDPDKVLFGSDSPWDDPGTAAALLRRMELGEERLEKIRYGNAARLLGL